MRPMPAVIRVATEDSSLITIGGLPLHPLAVHAVVVLLPLSALGLIGIILVPRWRAHFGRLVMAGLVVGAGASFVAVQAGEELARVTGISQDHERWGKLLGIVSVLLVLAALAWWWPIRHAQATSKAFGAGSNPKPGLAALGLATIALVLTAVVGHSGASAVWAAKLAAAARPAPATSAAVASASAANSSAASAPGYTMAVVRRHNSAKSCWSVISGEVYDLTAWINAHPGGPGVIQALCGIDGTQAFDNQHGGMPGPANELVRLKLGKLFR